MRVEASGPRTARYVVVGEAPGSAEAREGMPFVGPSGELLRDALRKMGLDPNEVYFTNVYKEYRPGNPTPTNDEIQESIPELAEELGSLPNVRHVLAVGNVSMQALTGKKGGILKSQGQLMEPRKAMEEALAGVDIMPIMHPAYVLRNNNYQTQNLFQEIVGSFVALGKKKDEEEIIFVKGLEAWEAFWEEMWNHTRGAIDIEATPVPWWHEDFQIISAAISFDGKRAYVIDTREDWKLFKKTMLQEGLAIRWVMHNGAYDRQALLSRGIDITLMFDTMTAQYLIDPNSRKGLQYLTSMYLGLPPYKDVDYKHILEEPWEKVAEMNGRDAIRTWLLFEHLMPKIRDDVRLNRLMQHIMLPGINALIENELKGMPIDIGRLADVTEEYERKLARIADQLREVARRYGMDKFNPRSNKDLQELIYDRIKLPVVKRTNTGAPSLDKEARLALRDNHPVMSILDEYKITAQRLGTFLYPWADMERDGKIHTKYKPNHVVSGRLSSEKPNMQQVPRDEDIRGVFGGLPGHKLVMLDYSQLELRLAAAFANEETMLDAYRNGRDLHKLTAERVLGDPEGRYVGKMLNFSLLYGAGWKTFQNIAWVQYETKLSDAQAQELREGFFKAYPGLKEWHRVVIENARAIGYVESPLGRRRYLPNINNMNDSAARAHDEKVALNHAVQSLGSDLMLLSLIEMHKRGFWIAATVHDSVILVAPEEEAEMIGKEAKEIMETIHDVVESKFGYIIRVPLVADLTIADHWQK